MIHQLLPFEIMASRLKPSHWLEIRARPWLGGGEGPNMLHRVYLGHHKYLGVLMVTSVIVYLGYG